jgi:hypothetical protein
MLFEFLWKCLCCIASEEAEDLSDHNSVGTHYSDMIGQTSTTE